MENEKGRKVKFSPLILFALVVCLFASPLIIWRVIGLPDFFQNNKDLSPFAENFYNYPLPPNSQVHSRKSFVTLLGSGNHCDFVAEQIITTELSEIEIRSYYEGVTFPPVRTEPQGFEDGWSGGIHPPTNPSVELVSDIDGDGMRRFRVRIVDNLYPPGLDYRCN
jgi:hypothetical protein